MSLVRGWICYECGIKNTPLNTIKRNSMTFHENACDWCGEVKSVTSSRNYGLWTEEEEQREQPNPLPEGSRRIAKPHRKNKQATLFE